MSRIPLAPCLGAASASAQPLGSFSWQLQPYCNRVTLNVVQTGAVYTMDGWDDQCSAATRAPNTSGTANIGIGYGAGPTLTTGNANILIGAGAGTTLVSGNSNIYMGSEPLQVDGEMFVEGCMSRKKQVVLLPEQRFADAEGP